MASNRWATTTSAGNRSGTGSRGHRDVGEPRAVGKSGVRHVEETGGHVGRLRAASRVRGLLRRDGARPRLPGRAKDVPLRLPLVQPAEFDRLVSVLVEELRSTGGSGTAVSKKHQPHVAGDVGHPVFQLLERNVNRPRYRPGLDLESSRTSITSMVAPASTAAFSSSMSTRCSGGACPPARATPTSSHAPHNSTARAPTTMSVLLPAARCIPPRDRDIKYLDRSKFLKQEGALKLRRVGVNYCYICGYINQARGITLALGVDRNEPLFSSPSD